MNTVERIFELLDDAKMEQQVFAEKIGTTKHVVSKWRTGQLKSYTKYIPQIAEVLGTTAQWLLTGTGDKIRKTAAPEGSGLSEEFARIFSALTPENQNEVIAKMLKMQRDK